MTAAPPLHRFTTDDAESLAREWYGMTGPARALPADRDQNFLIRPSAAEPFVLKIAEAGERSDVLDAQHDVLDHLAQLAPRIPVPRVLRTRDAVHTAYATGADGRTWLVHALAFLPGQTLAQAAPHSAVLRRGWGAMLGQVDLALDGFEAPALQREFPWDLRTTPSVLARHLDRIGDGSRRALVEYFGNRFREHIEPVIPSLRTSVIHNDGNDHNLIVDLSRGDTVVGLIDFGDMVISCTAFEPAVCAAYAMLDTAEPLVAASEVVSGYHDVMPLTEHEIAILYDAIAARLAISVVMSTYQGIRKPDDPYVTISERPAWEALARWREVDPRFAEASFRAACGRNACPRSSAVVRWIASHPERCAAVIDPAVANGPYVELDLRPGSEDIAAAGDQDDPIAITKALLGRVEDAGAGFGVGGYGECRRVYTTDLFRPAGATIDGWRTVHLGMDLFLESGTPVYAAFDGTVHALRDNAGAQDYGPTTILRHVTDDGDTFYTLYGHLARTALDGLTVGDTVSAGQPIATLGDLDENGGWAPHLHFQLVVDLFDHHGEFPGVCADRDRALWMSISPDPNVALRIPGLTPRAAPETEHVVRRRAALLGPSLSLHYAAPLHIVQGWMQHLFDARGRRFLDAANNVSHVGHAHPAVVEALRRQSALLNTNTRYLHELPVAYAGRLAGTMPDGLEVCFFVNSGSEANELALRMARAHTGASDVVVLDGGYHGNTAALIDVSAYKFDGVGGAGAPAHVHKVEMPDVFRGRYRNPATAGADYAAFVRHAVDRMRAGGRPPAAFLCESLPGCGGQIVLPAGYLAEAFSAVRHGGGVCIADEVQVGFGRVGSAFWGFETQQAVPDIVTLGKPMGNGHPIGAVVTTRAIADSFDTGMEYFNTYGGNAVSCAVGLAVLDVIEQEGLQQRARETGERLMAGARSLAARHAMIGDVRGLGLYIGIELVRDRETLEPAGPEARYVVERMKDHGILIGRDGPFGNVLKIKPPMVFNRDDADRLVGALDTVLAEPRLRHLQEVTGA
ncbi:MAG TPA: aminotransferase class III-fold pyridoxal phosphate-dependent enzyme [Gemmatimonadales bacterium]